MLATAIEWLSHDPLFYLSDEIIANIPENEGKKQKTMNSYFSFSFEGAGASSGADAEQVADPKILSVIGKDPLLKGKGPEMVHFLIEYTKKCCASTLSLNTQHLFCDVMWRIANGIDYHDESTECPPMPPEFEKRLVTQKGKRRMGILDWWQHGAGVDARIASCTGPGKNACGIKRNALQLKTGAAARCVKCDPF